MTETTKSVVDAYIDMEHPQHKELLTKEENYAKLAAVVEANPDDYSTLEAVAKSIIGGGADETNVFGGGADAPAAKKAAGHKRRDNSPQYTQSKIIAEEANMLQGTNYGAVAQLVSQKGAIVGYITPNPEHLDIAKSTKTDAEGNTRTRFFLRYAPPGVVKGIMVGLPMNAIEEVRKYTNTNDADPSICDVARANAAGQPFALQIMTPEVFTETFLSMEAAGSIRESDKLWAPCIQRRYMPNTKDYQVQAYMSLDDVNANAPENAAVLAGKNAIYLQISYRKTPSATAEPFPRAKHLLRNKLQAPGNCIPARKYETIKISESYSKEEAEAYTTAYFSRYNTMNYKGQSILNTIDAIDGTVVVNVDPNTSTKFIQSTKFFTTNGAESAMRTEIDHWYDKDEKGLPKKISPIGQELIMRKSRRTKADKLTSSIVYKEMQETQNAEGTAYVPDFKTGEFAKIGAAAAELGITDIAVSDIIKFLKDNNILRDKNSASAAKGRKRRQPRPVGAQAFGWSRTVKSDALQAALASLQK